MHVISTVLLVLWLFVNIVLGFGWLMWGAAWLAIEWQRQIFYKGDKVFLLISRVAYLLYSIVTAATCIGWYAVVHKIHWYGL